MLNISVQSSLIEIFFKVERIECFWNIEIHVLKWVHVQYNLNFFFLNGHLYFWLQQDVYRLIFFLSSFNLNPKLTVLQLFENLDFKISNSCNSVNFRFKQWFVCKKNYWKYFSIQICYLKFWPTYILFNKKYLPARDIFYTLNLNQL